jgi:hypothetical protein
MVGEKNGDSGVLETGAANLTYIDGLHSLRGIGFYGIRPPGSGPAPTFTADAGQRQIVWQVHGSDENNSGNNGTIAAALQLASAEVMSVETIGEDDQIALDDEGIRRMKEELANEHWVVASVFVKGLDDIGHAIVVTSYDEAEDKFTFWNPWTNGGRTFTGTDITNSTIKLSNNGSKRVLAYIHICTH